MHFSPLRDSLLINVDLCNNRKQINIKVRKVVITLVGILDEEALSESRTVCIPSLLGMFVYSERTSMVTSMSSFCISLLMADSLLIASVESLTYDFSLQTSGCRWKSTYCEILEEWQLTELMTGLPGLFFLWIFGLRLNLEAFGLSIFKPFATFSVINPSFWNLSIAVFIRSEYVAVGSL